MTPLRCAIIDGNSARSSRTARDCLQGGNPGSTRGGSNEPPGGLRLRGCFKETSRLHKAAVFAKATEAAALHEHRAVTVVHGPLKKPLIVMLDKAVVFEMGTGERLLRLLDAGNELFEAVRL